MRRTRTWKRSFVLLRLLTVLALGASFAGTFAYSTVAQDDPPATEEPLPTLEPLPTEEPLPTLEPLPTEVPTEVLTEEPAPTEEPLPTEEPATPEEPVEAQAANTVTITAQDGGGAGLADACFDAYTDDGGLPGTLVAGGCTDPSGVLSIPLDPGNYILFEPESPPGFLRADNQPFAITDGQETPLAVVHTAGTAQPLFVQKFDASGAAFAGACFDLYQSLGGQRGGLIVDDGCSGGDGLAIVRDETPGEYILVESVTPGGFIPSADLRFTVPADRDIAVNVYNAPQGSGTVLFVGTIADDNYPLGDACYEIWDDTDGNGSPDTLNVSGALGCDDGDGLLSFAATDGDLALFPGAYVLREVDAPTGYDPGPDVPFTLEDGKTTSLTVKNLPNGEQPVFGDLEVLKVDQNGDALPGSCFTLTNQAATETIEVCDGDDGDDGFLVFADLEPGTYTLHESLQPDGHAPAADQTVTINEGTNTVEVENVPLTGSVQIRTYFCPTFDNERTEFAVVTESEADGEVDDGCAPGPNVDFGIWGDAGLVAIPTTNDQGGAQETLAVGNYTLVEDPSGESVDFAIEADATVVVVVERFIPEEPPDNGGGGVGTLQIVTFWCLSGPERVELYPYGPGESGGDPGANCEVADSFYYLNDGEEFMVGDDGIAMIDLPAADHVLTEGFFFESAGFAIEPDLMTVVMVVYFLGDEIIDEPIYDPATGQYLDPVTGEVVDPALYGLPTELPGTGVGSGVAAGGRGLSFWVPVALAGLVTLGVVGYHRRRRRAA